MGHESAEIRDAIRKLAGVDELRAVGMFMGEVISVNEDDRQCEVTSVLDGESITYSEVNLSPERNDGLLDIPSVGSTVWCGKMPDGEQYVIKCSDIDKHICYIDGSNSFEFSSAGFIFNGGTLDGMVKVNSLVTKLNNVEFMVNLIITAIKTTWTPVAGDGGAALKILFAGFTTLTSTIKADLENTKVKQ